MTTRDDPRTAPAREDVLPLPALLVMALTGFLLIATETMPAGLLPQIAAGMDVGEGAAGQYVSAYALGTVLVAVPAVTLTRGMRRKPLLLVGIAGFLLATTVTAVSSDLVLSLAARFVAGAFSGLLWGMLAGYARRITAPRLAGRALSIASLGTPLGLALGTPSGAWLGAATGWRWSFVVMAGLAAITLVLVVALVPDAPGQRAETQTPLHRVLVVPGVLVVLATIVTWMLAHNTMYTYVAAYLRSADVGLSVDVALVVFGASAIVGIWITGLVVDRALRPLVIAGTGAFVVAGLVLLLAHGSVVAVLAAVVLWGVAFGGAAAQVQTAMGEVTGEDADVANSFIGVAFNLAIFAGGVLGAVLLGSGGDGDGLVLPVVMVVGAAVALVVVAASRTAFPRGR